jgi:hypothetical protein
VLRGSHRIHAGLRLRVQLVAVESIGEPRGVVGAMDAGADKPRLGLCVGPESTSYLSEKDPSIPSDACQLEVAGLVKVSLGLFGLYLNGHLKPEQALMKDHVLISVGDV